MLINKVGEKMRFVLFFLVLVVTLPLSLGAEGDVLFQDNAEGSVSSLWNPLQDGQALAYVTTTPTPYNGTYSAKWGNLATNRGSVTGINMSGFTSGNRTIEYRFYDGGGFGSSGECIIFAIDDQNTSYLTGTNGFFFGSACGNQFLGNWQMYSPASGYLDLGSKTTGSWIPVRMVIDNDHGIFYLSINGGANNTRSFTAGNDYQYIKTSHVSAGGYWAFDDLKVCEGNYCGEVITPGTIQTSLTNIVNASTINTYCVSYTGNGTGNECTTNGTIQFFNKTGDLTFTFYNITDYYNVTTTQTITAGSNTVNPSTYQALLNVSAYRLFLNTTISDFNTTNDQATNETTTGSLLLPANVGSNNLQTRVLGNYTLNTTCTVSTPRTTNQCNVTGVHDARYTFNASDSYSGGQLQNFTIRTTNTTIGAQATANTTSNQLNISLLQGYEYFFLFTKEGYEAKNVTLEANASTQYYQFNAYPAPSINIEIRDANTGNLITENVTITLTGNTTGQTVYTTTGGYFLQNITPDQYSVKLESVSYSQSTYIVTASTGSVYYLTAYLQQNVSEVVFEFVDSISSSVKIQGVTVTQRRLVNGSWQAVSTTQTDITGRTVMNYIPGEAYQFTATKTGYQTKEFSLDPVLFSSYSILMQKSTFFEEEQDYQSVIVEYEPNVFYDGQENEINITFYSPTGTLTAYAYTVAYPGGTITGTGNRATGEEITRLFNITGATIHNKVNITLAYTTSISDERSFTYQNTILVSPENTTFAANIDETHGLGLLDRIFYGTLIIIIVAGIITAGAGINWGMGIVLLLFGLFVGIGFWPWWSVGISFLVGFALLAGRTD